MFRWELESDFGVADLAKCRWNGQSPEVAHNIDRNGVPLKKLIGAALATMVLAGGVFLGGVSAAQADQQDGASQAGRFGQVVTYNNWPY